MCHHAKFRQNRPNRFWDIAIFQFSRWTMSAILDFEILKFLVSHQVGRAKVHHCIKFHQNRSRGWEILHLTFFKMAAVRQLGFLNWFLDQLVISGGLIYAIMLIGSHMRSIIWRCFRWPWVTPNPKPSQFLHLFVAFHIFVPVLSKHRELIYGTQADRS